MLRIVAVSCCALGLAVSLSGCGQPQASVLGKPSAPVVVSPVAKAKQARPATLVTVTGTMTEKCPTAGCWFILHDATGTIKVDTKAAGFTVVDVPMQSTVTATGKVVPDGSDRKIAATSVSY